MFCEDQWQFYWVLQCLRSAYYAVEVYDSHRFIKKFEIVFKFFMTRAGDEPFKGISSYFGL